MVRGSIASRDNRDAFYKYNGPTSSFSVPKSAGPPKPAGCENNRPNVPQVPNPSRANLPRIVHNDRNPYRSSATSELYNRESSYLESLYSGKSNVSQWDLESREVRRSDERRGRQIDSGPVSRRRRDSRSQSPDGRNRFACNDWDDDEDYYERRNVPSTSVSGRPVSRDWSTVTLPHLFREPTRHASNTDRGRPLRNGGDDKYDSFQLQDAVELAYVQRMIQKIKDRRERQRASRGGYASDGDEMLDDYDMRGRRPIERDRSYSVCSFSRAPNSRYGDSQVSRSVSVLPRPPPSSFSSQSQSRSLPVQSRTSTIRQIAGRSQSGISKTSAQGGRVTELSSRLNYLRLGGNGTSNNFSRLTPTGPHSCSEKSPLAISRIPPRFMSVGPGSRWSSFPSRSLSPPANRTHPEYSLAQRLHVRRWLADRYIPDFRHRPETEKYMPDPNDPNRFLNVPRPSVCSPDVRPDYYRGAAWKSSQYRKHELFREQGWVFPDVWINPDLVRKGKEEVKDNSEQTNKGKKKPEPEIVDLTEEGDIQMEDTNVPTTFDLHTNTNNNTFTTDLILLDPPLPKASPTSSSALSGPTPTPPISLLDQDPNPGPSLQVAFPTHKFSFKPASQFITENPFLTPLKPTFLTAPTVTLQATTQSAVIKQPLAAKIDEAEKDTDKGKGKCMGSYVNECKPIGTGTGDVRDEKWGNWF